MWKTSCIQPRVFPPGFVRFRRAYHHRPGRQQPFGRAWINKVRIQVDVTYGRDTARIRQLRVSSGPVQPGEPLTVTVLTQGFGEGLKKHTIQVPIPRHLAGEKIRLEVGAGTETIRDLPDPRSLDGYLKQLGGGFPSKAFVASLKQDGKGAKMAGKLIGPLPPSAQNTLLGQKRTAVTALYTVPTQHVFRTNAIVAGKGAISFVVADPLNKKPGRPLSWGPGFLIDREGSLDGLLTAYWVTIRSATKRAKAAGFSN